MIILFLFDVICAQKEVNIDGDINIEASFLKYYFKAKDSEDKVFPQLFAQSEFGIKYLDKLAKAETQKQKYDVIIEALIEVAEIVDSAATRSEVEHEISHNLFQRLTHTDERDKDFSYGIDGIKTKASIQKEMIDEDVTKIIDNVVSTTDAVRKSMMKKVRSIIQKALLDTRDTRYKVQESVRNETANIVRSSSLSYLVSFVCIQIMLCAIYYIYNTYRKRANY